VTTANRWTGDSRCTSCLDLSNTVQVDTGCIDLSGYDQADSTSSGTHDDLLDNVGVVNEITDDDWCSSDKENDAVFPFHHTASVAAMERIFAKQRRPNFVRPNGYISPLRRPTLLRGQAV